ncbi:hypothetical protein KIN20_013680 [Parelaphostrongylus tenuis]|uniref:Uncharacterized protein n=1 Tax=Parelaphostrongylus tenuis TaxID=148309 RepID=A0AAD5MXW9_PARTN|nr:hypothetical protein KIN20_013680 [Parelaphostrongylus tenuis]
MLCGPTAHSLVWTRTVDDGQDLVTQVVAFSGKQCEREGILCHYEKYVVRT